MDRRKWIKTKKLFKILILLFVVLPNSIFAVNYYVSANGNDNNSGTSTESAWKTLNKVNQKALEPGDAVLFRKGDTFYGALMMTSHGSPSNPIVYGSYGSSTKKPLLTGFTKIVGWKSIGNGIYKANTSVQPNSIIASIKASPIQVVLLNETQQAKGRYPNDTYLHFESHYKKTSITDNQLPSSPNWTGAELVILSSRWSLDKLPISNHSGRDIYYGGSISYEPRDNNFGYFIQNDLRCLDKLGEWFHKDGSFYMYFGSKDPNSYEIKVSTIESIIYTRLRENLIFKDLSFSGANGEAFYAYCGKNVTIKDCHFNHTGISAIRGLSCENFNILNNVINNSNTKGIFVDKDRPNIVIKGNVVNHTGLFQGLGGKQSAGIKCYANNSVIEENTVKNSGYIPIAFNGSNVLVKYNFIDNFCSVLDDGGGIYTYHGHYTDIPKDKYSNRKVINNIILNGIGLDKSDASSVDISSQAIGLYMDGGAGQVEFDGNTVVNCGYTGVLFNNTHNTTIKNTILFNNGISFKLNNRQNQDAFENLVITKNKFLNKDVHRAYVYSVTDLKGQDPINGISTLGVSDQNYYMNDEFASPIVYQYLEEHWASNSVQSWRSYSGHEKNSKIILRPDNSHELKIIYNNSTVKKNIQLPYPYTVMSDLHGNTYNGTVELQPFSSRVLYPTDIKSSQILNLHKGWNIVSSNLDFSDKKFEDVFSNEIQNGNLIKILDSEENSFEESSSSNDWRNTIGNFKNHTAYMIKVLNSTQIVVYGDQINTNINISLKKGWNLLAYPKNSNINALELFKPLIDNESLIKVQDESGNTIEQLLIFNQWVNNIGDIKPGKGYKVHVSKDININL